GTGTGTLTLAGVGVGAQTLFTAAQFLQLQYVAGANGTSDDIVVAPETASGVAGPALQISASVTGTRSIDAANALINQDSFTLVAQTAAILAPIGTNKAPTLTAVGNFTSQGGDTYNLAELYKATAPTGGTITTYNVALRGTSGGILAIGGVSVGAQTSFTATQFGQLQYIAGAGGSDDIVVAAQTATTTSSNAVEISNSITGTRSINAANALINQDTFTQIAQTAAILSAIAPNTAPKLTTVGNFSSQAGDTYDVAQLFKATAPTGGTIATYNVAIRSNGGGGGTLSIGGVSVGAQTSFTATQFAQLQYTAGAAGTDDLVVAAQTSTGVSGTAQMITNTVSGTRSINAANALINQDSFTQIAQSAGILAAISPNTTPTITTVGNTSSQAGDVFDLPQLFHVTAPSGVTIASYSVAVRGGGTLSIGGVSVGATTSFTPTQFNNLQYTAGAAGSDDLIVSALTTTGVSSNALQITNTINGVRSINGADALINQDQFTLVAQTASIFSQITSNTTPGIASVGNFTSQAGDTYNLPELFQAAAPSSGSIQTYNVAIRNSTTGSGILAIGGVSVGAATLFTATQFSQLQYIAGAAGSDDIVVTAQTATGVASEAIQVTNTVTGTRSLNASNALINQDTYILIGQLSSILSGTAATMRPSVSSPIEIAPPSVSASSLPSVIGAFQTANATTTPTTNTYQSLFTDAVGGVHILSAVAPTSIASLFEILNPGTGVGGSVFAGNPGLNVLFAVVAYEQAQSL
ncbi:MAG: hypothetical protein JO021_20850, partial [Alphaproteobacteria bacterium]|nr:hypothetical protein [Alphaproteobacteria bacterium]